MADLAAPVAEPGQIGVSLHELAAELFPLTRSITGPGYRETLSVLERVSGPMERHRFASGERVFDWTVPNEWTVRAAWIRDPHGDIVVDMADCNLHLVSYSVPVRRRMALEELQRHLHSLPEQPDAVPYRTSYYEESWGFCLADRQRRALPPGDYEVMIDASLAPGHVELGEVTIPGRSATEVLFSTYCCHPSMANNELSGPVVAAYLAHLMRERADTPRLTYRFLFAPETIGSLAYLSRFGRRLTEHLAAGYVLTCLGSGDGFTYRRSRRGQTLADRVAEHTLSDVAPARSIDFYPPRSDERQYCSPGFDLPVGCLSRPSFDEWPEYHTSLDDLSFITPRSLGESYAACVGLIEALEANETLRATITFGEPQLGRRGLYPNTGGAWNSERTRVHLEDTMFLLNYCDGANDLLAASQRCGRPLSELRAVADQLCEHGLLEPIAG